MIWFAIILSVVVSYYLQDHPPDVIGSPVECHTLPPKLEGGEQQDLPYEMQFTSVSCLTNDMDRNDEVENQTELHHFHKETFHEISTRYNEEAHQPTRQPSDSDNENIFQQMTNERPFSCDICGSRFKHLRNLVEHKRGKHEMREFRCPCGRIYHWRSNYVKHLDNCSVAMARDSNR